MELSKDVDHRHIVFIRFNPDTYTDTNGNKITSCWGTNKYGILTIKPTKKMNGKSESVYYMNKFNIGLTMFQKKWLKPFNCFIEKLYIYRKFVSIKMLNNMKMLVNKK